MQTFSREAIPGCRLIWGVSSTGTEAAFQASPSGQIRTKGTTPSMLGSEVGTVRMLCAVSVILSQHSNDPMVVEL